MKGLAVKNCYKPSVQLKKEIFLSYVLSALNPQAMFIACFEVNGTDSDLLMLSSRKPSVGTQPTSAVDALFD